MANMDHSVEPSASAPHALKSLRGDLLRVDLFAEALSETQPGKEVALDGVVGGAIALTAAAVADHFTAPVLLVLPTAGRIDDVVDDLNLFTAETVVRYPAIEARRNQVLRDDNYGERLRTLKQLRSPQLPRLIVTSIQALLQPAPVPQAINENTRRLQVGQKLDVDQLARWLVENDYHTPTAVELPGEFSLRGGILDLFATDWETPVRIELFDDEIESLRHFDLSTQRSMQAVDEIEVTVLNTTSNAQGCLTQYLPPDATIVLYEPP